MEQTKTFFEEYKRYLDLKYQARIYIKQQCKGYKESREARNITFQAKSGLFWVTKDISNGYAENTDTYFGGFSMTNPTVGTQYRAECTHYVVVNGVETSAYNETLPHTYGE